MKLLLQDRRSMAAAGTHKPLRTFLLVAGAAIVVAMLPFFSGLVGILILYIIVRRPFEKLRRYVPERVAAVLTAVGVLVILLIPGTWLAMTIVAESTAFLTGLKPDALATWLENTRIGNLDATRAVAGLSTSAMSWISGHAFAFVGGATSAIINIVIALFGLYYLLLDDGSLWRRVKSLLPLSQPVVDSLSTRFVTVTEALLLGTVLTAVLQGSLIGGAFALLGLHPAVVWGFVTACASVLPLFGSAIVWLPGCAVLLMDHRPGAAGVLLVVGGVVASNIDNVIRPLIYRRVSGIHPMVTLVGAFAGVEMIGLMGALLGPLVLSYFIELVTVYERAS